jgi:hypothetical protein
MIRSTEELISQRASHRVRTFGVLEIGQHPERPLDNVVRTVTENIRVLKLRQAGFEE